MDKKQDMGYFFGMTVQNMKENCLMECLTEMVNILGKTAKRYIGN